MKNSKRSELLGIDHGPFELVGGHANRTRSPSCIFRDVVLESVIRTFNANGSGRAKIARRKTEPTEKSTCVRLYT